MNKNSKKNLCVDCHGKGKVFRGFFRKQVVCPSCNGTGEININDLWYKDDIKEQVIRR